MRRILTLILVAGVLAACGDPQIIVVEREVVATPVKAPTVTPTPSPTPEPTPTPAPTEITSESGNSDTSATERPANNPYNIYVGQEILIPPPGICTGAISWDQASQYVETRKTVTGMVAGTNNTRSSGQTALLYFGQRPPNTKFVVVIPGTNMSDFDYSPEQLHVHDIVCVTGFIDTANGGVTGLEVPYIEATAPSQIVILVCTKSRNKGRSFCSKLMDDAIAQHPYQSPSGDPTSRLTFPPDQSPSGDPRTATATPTPFHGDCHVWSPGMDVGELGFMGRCPEGEGMRFLAAACRRKGGSYVAGMCVAPSNAIYLRSLTVRAGETLADIAKRSNTDLWLLAAVNSISAG